VRSVCGPQMQTADANRSVSSRSQPLHRRHSMIDSFARVSSWQQLYHLWELIVMLGKFLWGLLRLLGGG